jgi:hypothetical protein
MEEYDTSAGSERESLVLITGKPLIKEAAVMNRSFGAWCANQTRGRARGGISEPARCGQLDGKFLLHRFFLQNRSGIVEKKIYGWKSCSNVCLLPMDAAASPQAARPRGQVYLN